MRHQHIVAGLLIGVSAVTLGAQTGSANGRAPEREPKEVAEERQDAVQAEHQKDLNNRKAEVRKDTSAEKAEVRKELDQLAAKTKAKKEEIDNQLRADKEQFEAEMAQELSRTGSDAERQQIEAKFRAKIQGLRNKADTAKNAIDLEQRRKQDDLSAKIEEQEDWMDSQVDRANEKFRDQETQLPEEFRP